MPSRWSRTALELLTHLSKEKSEDTNDVIRRRNSKKDNQYIGQKKNDKTIQQILKIEKHEPHQKLGMNSGAGKDKQFLLH